MANLIQCMQILVINQNKILGLNSFARKTFYGGEEKWRWKYIAHSPYFAYFAQLALLAIRALLALRACFVGLFFIFCTFYIFCIFCMFCIFCIFCIVCIFVFFRIFCISYFPRRLFCLDTPMTGSPPHFQGQYVIENDYSWSHLVVTYTEELISRSFQDENQIWQLFWVRVDPWSAARWSFFHPLSLLLRFFLVAHLTYENHWGK